MDHRVIYPHCKYLSNNALYTCTLALVGHFDLHHQFIIVIVPRVPLSSDVCHYSGPINLVYMMIFPIEN